MKQLLLTRLKIDQFQKFDHKEIEFGANITDISGDNGTGKTTIYSSLTWLLFGKDAYGREKFDIKHFVDGKKQEHVDVSVEGEFLKTDGIITEPISLKRVLCEVWNDKTNTYKGDETKCYINNEPCLVSEFNTYIYNIVDEESFRMLTSINYFLSLPMEKQREYLCQMAGVRKVEDIVSGNKAWATLLSKKPSHLDVQGWIKSYKDKLKGYKDERKGIQPAINALTQSKPAERNWDEIENNAKTLMGKIDDINQSISSIEDSQKNMIQTKLHIQKSIADCEERRMIIESEINIKINSEKAKVLHELYKKNKDYNACKADVDSLRREEERLEGLINLRSAELEKLCLILEQKTNEYVDEKSKEYRSNESPVCPLADVSIQCDNKIVLEQFYKNQEKLMNKFNENKQKRLDLILADGRETFKQKEKIENELNELKTKCKTTSQELKTQLHILQSLNYISPDTVKINEQDIRNKAQEEIELIDAQVKDLRKQLECFCEDNSDKQNLIEQRTIVMQQYSTLIKNLGERDQIKAINEQIEKIRNRGVEISDNISECENIIDMLTEINRAIINDAEERINGMFEVTHWQTIIQQKNGDYKDICLPTVNGVSASLNTATRINICLDIINAISNYLQIKVPIFIDNKESVNKIIKMNTQLITLSVAPLGTPLTINY